MGLSFPTPGSEESLILPDQGIGVRIIRRPLSAGPEKTEDDGVYSVEIYEANSAAPAERLPLDAMKPETIDVADGDVTLEFLPTVGVVVAVRSEPGSPLYWLAGLLTIIGLVGFVRVPAYLLAQVGEWSPTKAFVIAQSNSQRELLSLETSLSQPETATPRPHHGVVIMQEKQPFVIGVAGGSGSGKTTVSTRIRDVVGKEQIAYLQHDNYYRDQGHLTFEERARVQLRPSGQSGNQPAGRAIALSARTATKCRCRSTTSPPTAA